MKKERLCTFSDGVIAVIVAIVRLIPDRRIENEIAGKASSVRPNK